MLEKGGHITEGTITREVGNLPKRLYDMVDYVVRTKRRC